MNAIEGVDFSPTKELGRVNRVDPLGITYVLIETKEVCRVVVHADTPEEAQEMAMEEERRGNAESIECTDARCFSCVASSAESVV